MEQHSKAIRNNFSAAFMYLVATIWALILIVVALMVKGQPHSTMIIEILSAGAVLTSLLMILSYKKRL